MSADYSQVELRIMAAFSGDESMIHAFRSKADIHRETAAKVFGVSQDEVTPDMRFQGKNGELWNYLWHFGTWFGTKITYFSYRSQNHY